MGMPKTTYVPRRYKQDRMCVLTSGTTLVEGAHIIDVGVTKKLGTGWPGDAINL